MAEQKAIQDKAPDSFIIPVKMCKLNSGHFLVVERSIARLSIKNKGDIK